MNVLGRERGWGPYTRATFDKHCSLEGALYVGDAETVAEKIIFLRKNVGITALCYTCQLAPCLIMKCIKAIELLGKEVAPLVRAEIERWEAEGE